MSLSEVRTANEAGRVVLVMSEGLDEVIFANTAAASLFALAEGEPEKTGPLGSSPAARQLIAVAPVLHEDGEAMLRLKGGAGDLQVWVTAHVLMTQAADGTAVALLTAPVPGAVRPTEESLAARLLKEAGLSGAAIVTSGGRVHAAQSPAADFDQAPLSEAARGFLAGDEDRANDSGIAFWRVASDLALVLAPPVATRLEPAPEPEPESPPEPAKPKEARSPIGALLERLRSRENDPAVPAAPLLPDPVEEVDENEHEVAREEAPAFEDAPQVAAAPSPEETDTFSPRFDGEAVRFVWRIDAEGHFHHISPEFAEIVGPAAADVAGIAFAEVAEAFGFDENGEIAGLLERRDTWSGRSVYWPVEGTDRKVLVDLAALPIYGRERVFEGFRGFGVVRPAESIEDPEAIGRILANEPDDEVGVGEDEASGEKAGAIEDAVAESDEGGETRDTLGETAAETPPIAREREPEPGEPTAPYSSVVRLDDRRRREDALSPSEKDAFRAIGAKLRPADEESEGGAAGPADGEARLANDLSSLLAAVPTAILIEAGGQPVLANAPFFELTGYRELADFVAAGGLDALFPDTEEDEDRPRDTLQLIDAEGRRIEARVHMQRVNVLARSCLVFSFVPLAEPAETPLAEAPADASLREEVEELRSVLDTATDGILLLDTGGAVRSMNGSAQALFGRSPDDYLGRPFTEFLAPESRKPAQDYLESLRDEGLASILNDGREVTADVAGRGVIPLFITLGRLSEGRGWCVVLRDIAHWKSAEAELVTARRQAEDASLHKSRFLANISHELRTPLNAIIGFADVMASETYGPIGHERYMEYLRDIKRSGHHVLDLVNDLLDISKIEAGKVELAFEAVALNDVVSEVVSLMQPQAGRGRVIVRSNLPAGIPPVVADRRTVRQIALNLVANAVRFTPAGGQIIVSTSYGEDGDVSLRFRDSGIGMTDREIEIALTPFQQVNAAGKERGDGTGLGLPLTKAMVEANRAQFRIASTPGEGTLIEITFPAQRVLAH